MTYAGSVDGAPFTSVFEGSIVATRTIPEPSALVFGIFGMAGLIGRRKR